MTTAVSTPTSDRLREMAVGRVAMALDEVQHLLDFGGQFDLPSMKFVKTCLTEARDVLIEIHSDLRVQTGLGYESVIRLNYASQDVQRAILSSRCTQRDRATMGDLKTIIDQTVGLVEALLLVAPQA